MPTDEEIRAARHAGLEKFDQLLFRKEAWTFAEILSRTRYPAGIQYQERIRSGRVSSLSPALLSISCPETSSTRIEHMPGSSLGSRLVTRTASVLITHSSHHRWINESLKSATPTASEKRRLPITRPCLSN